MHAALYLTNVTLQITRKIAGVMLLTCRRIHSLPFSNSFRTPDIIQLQLILILRKVHTTRDPFTLPNTFIM